MPLLLSMLAYFLVASAIVGGAIAGTNMLLSSMPEPSVASAEVPKKIGAGIRKLPPIAKIKPTPPSDISAAAKQAVPPYAAMAREKAMREAHAPGEKKVREAPRIKREALDSYAAELSSERPRFMPPNRHSSSSY